MLTIRSAALALVLAGCGDGGGATFGVGHAHLSPTVTNSRTGGAKPASGDANPAAQAAPAPVAAPAPASAPEAPPSAGAPAPAPAPDPAVPAPPQDVPETRSLYWAWPCAKAPTPASPTDPKASVVTGPGDFVLESAPGGVAVEIGGRLCDPAKMLRDIVFVIDVSTSMRDFLNLGNDPVKNGTCARNDAVNLVLTGLPADAHVALVTFDGAVKRDSGGFLSPAAFKTQFATADILCERGGNTNYLVALQKAQSFLATARPDAAQEIYFVSDGMPDSDAVSGLDVATALKKTATIATLMLKGDPALLNQIASTDAAGAPLSTKIDDASTLAQTLANLADVKPVSAALTYGAPSGAPSVLTIDPTASPNFRTQTITINQTDHPDGVTASLEVTDSRGVKAVTTGKLVWKAP